MEHRILVVGDIHLVNQGSAPGYRTETYTDDLLKKLEETVNIAKEKEATCVLWLGDVFDHKAPSKTNFALVNRVQDLLLSYGVVVYVLVGNHDLAAGGNLESLQKQPIGSLRHIPNVVLLTEDHHDLDEDVTLYPVPGVPLGEDWAAYFNTASRDSRTRKRRIVAAHQLIVPDVSAFPEKARSSFYDAADVAMATDASLVLYGDVHSYHGFYVRDGVQGKVGLCNMGSICRMTVGDVDHTPRVMLLTIADDTRRSLGREEIVLQAVQPSEEVFRLEQKQAEKQHQQDIDDTIRQLKSTRVHKFSIETVVDEIRANSTADEAVRDTAVELIEIVR